MSRLDALLTQMEHPHLKTIDLSLGRMERLLEALGSPEKQLPPVIHVAGTNGKGSLVAYLRAMFTAAGKRVHVYTSPHLVRFHERIILAGSEVTDEALLPALERIHELRDDYPSTFFEGTTAAAFTLFASVPADVLLLEVGLGGRLDATNVIAKPVLTAITPISFDHQEYLGNTLAKIAGEKAGILKKDTLCVVGPQEPEAMDAICHRADKLGVTLWRYGLEWQLDKANCHGQGWQVTMSHPSLSGAHQWQNAATAVACMEMLSQYHPALAVKEDAVHEGIQRAHWPARLQHLQGGWCEAQLPAGSQVWLDGGHNPAAAAVIAAWVQAASPAHPRILICGMLADKDAVGFLKPLRPHFDQLVLVPVVGEKRAAPMEAMEASATASGWDSCLVAKDMKCALSTASKVSKGGLATVVIAGSLYLAGQVLAQERVLQQPT